MTVYVAAHRPDLKDAPHKPRIVAPLKNCEDTDEFFAAIRQQDILLHHPYESFASVAEFITRAANDPKVLAIKMTLYRASGDSPIIKALMRAAENGKQVTAVVELKARFDEENNIQWARAMEEAGVHVLYGLVGLKTHSKLTLVVRREEKGICHYVHLGTGNYNEVTARLYTDLGMLTFRKDIGEDAAKIFNLLTGMSQFPGLDKLRMAPFGLQEHFLQLIEREIAHAKKRVRNPKLPKAHIIAKMNALEEPEIIKALYRASQAGVQIDLIIRGFSCLRPGVPGLSENIRVISIVDRFLEHSRIFYFSNGGESEIYAGSADWMPRNFFRRVEVVFPVEEESLKRRMHDEILLGALADNVKARILQEDGTYRRARKSVHPRRFQELMSEKKKKLKKAVAQTPLLEVRSPLTHEVPQVQRTMPEEALLAADGRAGTEADPVLVSLRETLREQDEARTGKIDGSGPENIKLLNPEKHVPDDVSPPAKRNSIGKASSKTTKKRTARKTEN